MTLGQKIKKLRNESDLTQKDLSNMVNVTFQTVSKWENDENEPDVSTLKKLASLFGCSLDYLLSEEEEQLSEEAKPEEEKQTTVIIHQKEMHVCEKCGRDIPEDDLVMEDICTRHASRGHSAEYRKGYYHTACLEEVNKERAEKARLARVKMASSGAKKSFGWGIAGGIVALAVSLGIFFGLTEVHPALVILYSLLIAYAIFAAVYCIVSGSYIGEVFLWCASLSIKFPGLIFSWDLEGFAWLIAMKILFAVLGFIVGVLALMLAIVMAGSLGAISFPFVLIHNIRTDYEDTL